METVNADQVRIPRKVRDAVARHETVLVTTHDRPTMAIVHPDHVGAPAGRPRGRPLREVIDALSGVPLPDPDFAEDMEAVRASIGRAPEDPWASF